MSVLLMASTGANAANFPELLHPVASQTDVQLRHDKAPGHVTNYLAGASQYVDSQAVDVTPNFEFTGISLVRNSSTEPMSFYRISNGSHVLGDDEEDVNHPYKVHEVGWSASS